MVRVEQRARLQVLGDRWFGAGRGRRTFASVSTGEVLGVGVLYDGEVMAPPGGRSGAHMTVSASGERCTCGSRGCWKTLATTGWLRSRARAAGLAQASLDELVRSEDALAGQVVEEYAHNLALGLVNVQQLFAPGLFILHGEAREGGERFRTLVEERLREAVAFAGAEQPRVLVGTAAVDDVALLGGAGLVLSRL
ncbi:ROK family protein [Actinomadura keratinilytica]